MATPCCANICLAVSAAALPAVGSQLIGTGLAAIELRASPINRLPLASHACATEPVGLYVTRLPLASTLDKPEPRFNRAFLYWLVLCSLVLSNPLLLGVYKVLRFIAIYHH